MHTPPHHLADLGMIIVAAGNGERLGAGVPKAFVKLGDRTLLEHSLRTVLALPYPGQAVLVVPDGFAEQALQIASDATDNDATEVGSNWRVSVVPGGRERHESVRNGLGALQSSITTVLVHDAARPLTPTDVFERVITAVHHTSEGAIPVIPIADTVKEVDEAGTVITTVDRSALRSVQTPQGFTREMLVAAHEAASRDYTPTDDAAVVQMYGGVVRAVPGSGLAHKVTTPADLLMLQGVLRTDDVAERPPK